MQARAMSASVAECRNAQRRRVELVGSGDGNALRLRATPPDREMAELDADGRAVMIAAAVDRSDTTLEAFNTALKTLRTTIRTVDSTETARERLRDLAGKARATAWITLGDRGWLLVWFTEAGSRLPIGATVASPDAYTLA